MTPGSPKPLPVLQAAIEEELTRAKAEGGGDLSMVYLTIEDATAVLAILGTANGRLEELPAAPVKGERHDVVGALQCIASILSEDKTGNGAVKDALAFALDALEAELGKPLPADKEKP